MLAGINFVNEFVKKPKTEYINDYILNIESSLPPHITLDENIEKFENNYSNDVFLLLGDTLEDSNTGINPIFLFYGNEARDFYNFYNQKLKE